MFSISFESSVLSFLILSSISSSSLSCCVWFASSSILISFGVISITAFTGCSIMPGSMLSRIWFVSIFVIVWFVI